MLRRAAWSAARLGQPQCRAWLPGSCRSMSEHFSFPISLAKPGDNPRLFYEEQVKAGNIKMNDKQLDSMVQLEKVWEQMRGDEGFKEGGGKPQSSFMGMFGLGGGSKESKVKGLYLYGGVGCGKTFIMDIFYQCAPTKSKRRAHFHKFMLEVHQRLHEIRKKGKGRADVSTVAKDMVREGGKLLCFDEFNVTDVGDAVILKNLFEKMWEEGAVLVSTSNRPPTELYKNGIQRDLFVPCIKAIEQKCMVHCMDSGVDFRLLQTESNTMYVVTGGTPEGVSEGKRKLDAVFDVLTKHHKTRRMSLITQGRTIEVEEAYGGVAIFTFADLCSKPTGASDFLAIARAFHTILVHDIPFLSMERLPEVRRLITLIDVLYDHKVKLLCSAAAEPFKLFIADKGAAQDEAFAFDRTASRLKDMMSQEYKVMIHQPPAPPPPEDDGHPAPLSELIDTTLGPNDIKLIWSRYDEDGSGFLTRAEVQHMLEDVSYLKLGHRNVTDDAVQDAMDSMDENGDGQITHEEFDHFVARDRAVWYF